MNVACNVGPNVVYYPICFPSKTNVCNLIDFIMIKTTQNSISSTLQVYKLQNHVDKFLIIDLFPIIPKVWPNFP